MTVDLFGPPSVPPLRSQHCARRPAGFLLFQAILDHAQETPNKIARAVLASCCSKLFLIMLKIHLQDSSRPAGAHRHPASPHADRYDRSNPIWKPALVPRNGRFGGIGRHCHRWKRTAAVSRGSGAPNRVRSTCNTSNASMRRGIVPTIEML